MRGRITRLLPEFVLVGGLLLSWGGLSQMPPPPVGRLQITSTPQGAKIAINDQARPELTNVTLVVSPGNYKVSIVGGPGNLNCVQSVQVQGGKTVVITCPMK